MCPIQVNSTSACHDLTTSTYDFTICSRFLVCLGKRFLKALEVSILCPTFHFWKRLFQSTGKIVSELNANKSNENTSSGPNSHNEHISATWPSIFNRRWPFSQFYKD